MARLRAIEPLALTAASLAAASVVIYVWMMRDQGTQPFAWVVCILVGGGCWQGTARCGSFRADAPPSWSPAVR
jgi:hypothetical protein